MEWMATILDGLWRSALAGIPLVLIVWAICRYVVRRSATRHALWMVVLVALLVGGFVPPIVEAGRLGSLPRDWSRFVQDVDVTAFWAADGVVEAPSAAPALGGRVTEVTPTVVDASEPRPERPRLQARPFVEDKQLVARQMPVGRDAEREVAERMRVGRGRGSAARLPDVPVVERSSAALDAPVCSLAAQLPAVSKPVALPVRRVALHEPSAESSQGVEPAAGVSSIELTAPKFDWPALLLAVPNVPVRVWLIGVLLLLLVQLPGVFAMRRLLRRAMPAGKTIDRTVATVAKRLQVTAPVTYVVDRAVSPMIWCGRVPRLVLPYRLWQQLDAPGRKAVICHELAHLRRRDHWWCRLEFVVAALFWWNPLVWWIRRQLREEADLSCDAWVTWLMPQRRRAYAEALLHARSQSSGGMSAAGVGLMSGSARRLARRITMVMTESKRPGVGWSGAFCVALVLAASWTVIPAWACPPTPSKPKPAPVPTTPDKRTGVTGQVSNKADSSSKKKRTRNRTRAANRGGGRRAPKVSVSVPDPCQSQSSNRGGSVMSFAGPRVGGRAPRAMVSFPQNRPMPQRQAMSRLQTLQKKMERLQAEMEALQKRGWSSSGMGGGGSRSGRGMGRASGGMIVRRYELPARKLKLLTALLVREDVPLRVRPLDDAIEVHGTAGDHEIFSHFVEMIREGDERRNYVLPSGKRSALYNLMALPDVAQRVGTNDRSINMQGTPLEHVIFNAFCQLIHPTDEGQAIRDRVSQLSGRYRALQRSGDAAAMVRGLAQRARRESEIKQEQVQQLNVQSDVLRQQADELRRQAETLERQVKELRKKAKALGKRGARGSSHQEQHVAQLSEAARALVESHYQVDAQADALNRLARELVEQAKAVRDDAQTSGVRARELENAFRLLDRVSANEEALSIIQRAGVPRLDTASLQQYLASIDRVNVDVADSLRYAELALNGAAPGRDERRAMAKAREAGERLFQAAVAEANQSAKNALQAQLESVENAALEAEQAARAAEEAAVLEAKRDETLAERAAIEAQRAVEADVRAANEAALAAEKEAVEAARRAEREASNEKPR